VNKKKKEKKKRKRIVLFPIPCSPGRRESRDTKKERKNHTASQQP
jgi:hypothetical protein